MGICHHTNTEGNKISVQNPINDGICKLVLLGAGSCGKSTVLKQLRYLYVYKIETHKTKLLINGWIHQIGIIIDVSIPIEICKLCHTYYDSSSFPDDKLHQYGHLVFKNVFKILSSLLYHCSMFGYSNDEDNKRYIDKVLKSTNDILYAGKAEWKKMDELSYAEWLQCFQAIWSDSGIQKTYNLRHQFSLMDNASYFLQSVQRIINKEYVPTFLDVVHTRSLTTGGINSETFVYETNNCNKQRFQVMDIGGTRIERRKWIQCFDDLISGVLFCIALSGYDQVLYEDYTANRFEEAISLLNEVCTNNYYKPLRKAKFIIFLNKSDIFKKKIKNVAFQYKNEFGPSSDYNEIIVWLKNMIRSFDVNRTFYFHVITATNTQCIDNVFQKCYGVVTKKNII